MSVNSKMTAIADAIRSKTKKTGTLTLDQMATDIAAIDTSKPEQAKTATPSLSRQTISPDNGKVLSGVTVEPITASLLTSLDSDFKAENIAEGVDMFGVVGTMAAGGGAAVETCTVEITSDSAARILVLAHSHLATDGKVSTSYTDYGTGVGSANISLENVVCGSLIYVSASSSWLSCRISNNVRMFNHSHYNTFEAPTTANSIGTIYFYDDD